MNITPQNILNLLQEKNRQLTMKNEEYEKLSEKLAEAKRNYKIARTQKITELKIKGESVTLIPKLVEGDKIVADLEYKMNVAEGVYKACSESIKDIRNAIETGRSILSWLKVELHESK